jgi:purine-binding chemotaxis protein CheW
MSQSHDGAVRKPSGKFLTFFLGGEEYGLEILKVREIIGLLPITRVPRMPEDVLGVVNLRGKVIPVIDLKKRVGMSGGVGEERQCVIVVQAAGIEAGVLVERVSEVVDVAAEDVEDPPSFGASVRTDYLLGVAKANGRVKLLLDIDDVLGAGAELEAATAARS